MNWVEGWIPKQINFLSLKYIKRLFYCIITTFFLELLDYCLLYFPQHYDFFTLKVFQIYSHNTITGFFQILFFFHKIFKLFPQKCSGFEKLTILSWRFTVWVFLWDLLRIILSWSHRSILVGWCICYVLEVIKMIDFCAAFPSEIPIKRVWTCFIFTAFDFCGDLQFLKNQCLDLITKL